MSLNIAIDKGREHRKQYRRAKAVDCTCRNHGTCKHCENNRMYQRNKAEEASKQALSEINN